MVSNLDYTAPTTQFAFDVNKSNSFKKDNQNYINVLGIKQLNTLDNISLLDIFLSANHVIEPHYHQNSAELVYCISGSAIISLLNPYTKQLQNYTVKPGQVVNVPQAWWHYEVALENSTHLLAIFNSPTPDVILGSDLLKLTPTNIMAQTYCLDESQWKKTIAPVQPATFIGPHKNCNRQQNQVEDTNFVYQNQNYLYPYQNPYTEPYQHPRYWG